MTDDVSDCRLIGCDDQGDTGEAFSETVCPENAPSDPDLVAIISAWPTLPADMKATILAMVKRASE
jgi:hypothetical protein